MPDMIVAETHGEVALVRFNRPAALNALCDQMMAELGMELAALDADPTIGAIVITGSEKAFAAGADIKEMQHRRYPAVLQDDFIAPWEAILRVRKPILAAVSGFALGGGCEIAMMCDLIVCADTARFGQPEINLGIMPGAGGTQRFTRAIGKSKAMDMCLTGRMMDAAEAERANLVARIFPAATLIEEALAMAAKIAAQSRTAALLTKRSINAAFDTTLTQGAAAERALFLSLFGSDDQKEGMDAFIAKRKPVFRSGGAV